MLDPWLGFAITIAVCIVLAVVATAIVAFIVRLVARKRSWPGLLVARARRPFRMVILVVAVWVALALAFPERDWMPAIDQAMTILLIGSGSWLAIGLVRFGTDTALGRYSLDTPDNRVARRIRTQMLILRRLAVAIIVVIAIGAALLTFPAVRTLGASVLASAGIASVVAGLAAQSVLANMFAGIQLVFSEALRVDDVIVAEGEWGRVEEITLSYVVLNLWDERRLVLPCTYFTTQPFENWTRQGSELFGAVELDMDWRVSTTRMREHLAEVLAESTLWDRRASVLQITDATGGLVRVRILVTAANSANLWDLRCNVREAMVTWAQRTLPTAMPVQRVMMTPESPDSSDEDSTGESEGLFSGSIEAQERGNAFTQAVPVVTSDGEDGGDGDADQRSTG
ncbi:mechanosensitive ion channel family protein [Microbacterium sp. LRZ72]|uniref:mechanosensitive ion channel family protein n=1 Tax=Microbacterium sp. LRZ72 TaxID=2942481 RepID=UPI0029A2A8C0|nr:mechanosensitive ion channel domain-containing protein [Microbacterium sp. LRZ72]MDX2376030.1 mechanosensitive ion channel family protein [Microbacterium sp. LRZ72]